MMFQDKSVVQLDVTYRFTIVNSKLYMLYLGAQLLVSDEALGFDVTETDEARKFDVWVIKSTGLYRAVVDNFVVLESLYVSNAVSVSAKITSIGPFVALLVANQLQIKYGSTTKTLQWGSNRKNAFDLEVDYDGLGFKIVYSKTSSPEQVYVDEYSFSGATIINKVSLYDFSFGVNANIQ